MDLDSIIGSLPNLLPTFLLDTGTKSALKGVVLSLLVLADDPTPLKERVALNGIHPKAKHMLFGVNDPVCIKIETSQPALQIQFIIPNCTRSGRAIDFSAFAPGCFGTLPY
jgi:hypothetical protein